jgi:hypothetical protein
VARRAGPPRRRPHARPPLPGPGLLTAPPGRAVAR